MLKFNVVGIIAVMYTCKAMNLTDWEDRGTAGPPENLTYFTNLPLACGVLLFASLDHKLDPSTPVVQCVCPVCDVTIHTGIG